jgi:hypothetical protein
LKTSARVISFEKKEMTEDVHPAQDKKISFELDQFECYEMKDDA